MESDVKGSRKGISEPSITVTGEAGVLPDHDSRKRRYDPRNSPDSYGSAGGVNENLDNGEQDGTEDEVEFVSKRPRLTVDTSINCQPLCEALSSSESFMSSSQGDHNDVEGSSPSPSLTAATTSLSAYLEDIVSDEDPMMDDNDVTPPQAPARRMSIRVSPISSPSVLFSPPLQKCADSTSSRPSKEGLLMMMEKLDRDITTCEQHISALEKRQSEMEKSSDSSLLGMMSTSTSARGSTPSVYMGSSATTSDESGRASLEASPSPSHSHNIRRSTMETILSENKLKARSSQFSLAAIAKLLPQPLYYQPSEAPRYRQIIESHKKFRPRLLQHLKKRHLEKHVKEVQLCEQYDTLMTEWEKKVEKWETSGKKRTKDSKSRELFEKLFPELRTKRDQLRDQAERFNKSGVRSFGVVRSEAELDELAFELFEQEEAMDRHRRTHATIPSMLTDEKERKVQFISTNGLVKDPMAIYRESKAISTWTDEEKRIFKEKFVYFPKNFGKIATFLPNKSIRDCVRYYYLSKKNENFKQMARKASFKRRRQFHKPSEFQITLLDHSKSKSLSSEGESFAVSSLLQHRQNSTSFIDTTIDSPKKLEYHGWSEEEIASLKEGLRKYGRAWGKVYREVGGQKTATQCKQFYDDFYQDKNLDLIGALTEHSTLKNAEKAKKKAEVKRNVPMPTAAIRKRLLRVRAPVEKEEEERASESSSSNGCPSAGESEEEDEGDDASTSSNSSESETTITDSGAEDHTLPEETKFVHQQHQLQYKSSSSSTSTATKPQRRRSSHSNSEPLQSPLELFLSAAEVLSNTVSPEVALHDHNYHAPLPADIQASSGLQLIAAAAAVVSPSLSKSAAAAGRGSTMSPVKAPRGRPPSQQKRGSSTSSQKLAPSFLTPTSGAVINVPLQEIKPTLRSRSRSAPTEKTRGQLQSPRGGVMPPLLSVRGARLPSNIRNPLSQVTYTRGRGDHPNLISPGVLKSMVASQPQPATISPGTPHSTPFEALVNVAVAAPPADLPRSTAGISLVTQPIITNAKGGSRREGNSAVLELNLGQISLLLAANNRQAALLLPPTSIIGKIPANSVAGLANLVSLSDSLQGATISLDTTALYTMAQNRPRSNARVSSYSSSSSSGTTSTASNSGSANSSDSSNSIPLVNPTTLSLEHMKRKGGSASCASNSAPSSNVATPILERSNSSSTTATPTSEDLSNLNLLSSLVAGLASKPDSNPVSTTSSPSVTTDSSSSPSLDSSSLSSSFTTIATVPVTNSSAHSPLTASSTSSSLCTAQDHHPHRPPVSVPATASTAPAGPSPSTPAPTAAVQSSNPTPTIPSLSPSLPAAAPTCSSQTPPTITPAMRKNAAPGKQQQPSPPLPPLLAEEEDEEDEEEEGKKLWVTSSAGGKNLQHERESKHGFPRQQRKAVDGTAGLSHIAPSGHSFSALTQLYARTLSLPMDSAAESSPDEEDHLEYATRGISELSKLLGTDNGLESPASDNSNNNSVYRSNPGWSPDELLCNPFSHQTESNTSSSVLVNFTSTATGEVTPAMTACTVNSDARQDSSPSSPSPPSFSSVHLSVHPRQKSPFVIDQVHSSSINQP